VLDTGRGTLRILVHIQQPNGAAPSGTLDSPDQGAFGIPLSDIAVEGARLRFAAPSVAGTYEGRVGRGHERLAG
jgi:hypothetical protein